MGSGTDEGISTFHFGRVLNLRRCGNEFHHRGMKMMAEVCGPGSVPSNRLWFCLRALRAARDERGKIMAGFEHILVNLDGEDDRDGFPFAGDDFRFGEFRFHGRRKCEW